MAEPVSSHKPAWAGYAACLWGLLFAALSFYWAAGGRAGLGTLSKGVREPALDRDAAFVAVIWATGALKVLAALLGLALVQPWGTRLPRRALLAAGWGTGMLLTLYGAVGIVNALLAELGVIASSDPATVRWYLFVWEPIWLLGGLLFLAAARHHGRTRRVAQATLPTAASTE